MIYRAYEELFGQEDTVITDDAMVVEKFCHVPVTLMEGSYRNIKITTPEDMLIAEAFLNDVVVKKQGAEIGTKKI